MAKVTSVTVGFRRLYKHPFEDFENFTVEGSVTVEVGPDETPAEAAAKSFPILREQLRETFKEFRPRPPAKKEPL